MAGAEEPLQIPPTRAPRRRRRRLPRAWKTAAIVATVAAVGLVVSSIVDDEVNRRLATIPVATTTTTAPATTTTVIPPPRPTTPRAARTDAAPVTVVEQAEPTTTTVTVREVPQSTYDIVNKLDKLAVRDERGFGYGRHRFGAWRDDDGDGCTVRDDVLVAQAIQAVRRSQPCDIVSGRWLSPYDNRTVEVPDNMRVDHVVGLYEAWKSGAWNWSDARRNSYLNDVSEAGAVLAVSKFAYEDKAGRDPGDWLPTNESFRCTYLQTWVDVKTKWKLSVDAGERESIAAAALGC